MDPERLLFAAERLQQVRDVAPARAEVLATLDAQYGEVFRGQPFYEAPDLARMLRRVLDGL